MTEIDITLIRPNPNHLRKSYNPEKLRKLVSSIRQNGLLNPILVKPIDGGYEIIHGEQRWRACQEAGFTTIQVEIRDLDKKSAFLVAFIENLQHDRLNPIEEAEALRFWMDKFGDSQAEVSEQIGKSQQYISARLSLLRLANPVQELIARGVINRSLGRELAKIPDQSWQLTQANMAARGELTPKGLNDAKEDWRIQNAREALRDEINLFLDLHHELQPFRRAIAKKEIEYFHEGSYLRINTTRSEFTWQTWHWPKYSGQVPLIGPGSRMETDLGGLDELIELDSVPIFSPDEWQEFSSFDEGLALLTLTPVPVRGWGRALRWPDDGYQFHVDPRYRRDYDHSYGRFLFEREVQPCFVKQGWGIWLIIEFNDGLGQRTRRRFFAHDTLDRIPVGTLSETGDQPSTQEEFETRLLDELQAHTLAIKDIVGWSEGVQTYPRREDGSVNAELWQNMLNMKAN